MNTQITSVLEKVNSLARQRGWSQAIKITDALLAPTLPEEIIVAVADDLATTPFQSWLVEVAAGTRLATIPLNSLTADPLPLVTARKIIVVLKCGRLLEPVEVNFIRQICLSRPAGSYAIVLVGAEAIETEQDLDAVERIAWGVLVPPSVERLNLSAYQVYLWSDHNTVELIRERVRQEQEALIAWLQPAAVNEYEDGLGRYQALYAIEMAISEARQSQPSRSEDQPDPTRSIKQNGQLVHELRDRLVGRIETSADLIKRALVVSLDKLKSDLDHGLHPYLSQKIRDKSMSLDEQNRLIGDYVFDQISRWQKEAEAKVSSLQTETIQDSRSLFNDIDWSLINQLAAQNSQEADYPNALFNRLTSGGAANFQAPLPAAEWNITEGTRFNQNADPMKRLIPVLISSGVTVVAVQLLTGNPIIAIGAAGAAAVGIDRLGQKGHQAKLLNDSERQVRKQIGQMIPEAKRSVEQQVQTNLQALRQLLDKEFDTLEVMLKAAIEANHPVETPEDLFTADLKTLTDYLNQVTALKLDQ